MNLLQIKARTLFEALYGEVKTVSAYHSVHTHEVNLPNRLTLQLFTGTYGHASHGDAEQCTLRVMTEGSLILNWTVGPIDIPALPSTPRPWTDLLWLAGLLSQLKPAFKSVWVRESPNEAWKKRFTGVVGTDLTAKVEYCQRPYKGAVRVVGDGYSILSKSKT